MKSFIVLCFSLCLVEGSKVDGCNNYTVLSEADRAQGHIVIDNNYRCDRDDLVPGWYRFQGAAGHRMADRCVLEHHCGTQYPGWLNGTHPTVSEGVVSRLVCYPHNYYYWRRNQSSNCCFFSNNIRVRNCGAFVVYELQKPPDCKLRYCGNGNAVDGCNNYTVLSEADRAQGHIVINASNYRCDGADLVPGWYRFQGAAGDRMAGECVPMNHCGTEIPGWLSGAHPTVSEGVVTRKVCHSWSNSCCYWFNTIRIKNCGAYFVYEFPRLYRCYTRFCGNRRAVAVTCPALRLPTHGKLLGCSTTEMLYGTVCRFSCKEGSETKGSTVRNCTENGTWSGTDLVCTETKDEKEILDQTSSLAIAIAVTVTLIVVGVQCLRKRHFLIRKWRRFMGRDNVSENNQGYEDRVESRNNPQQANDGFQNPRNQGGRGPNDMQEENVGVGNQGYAERDGNQNSVATTEEIELNVINRGNTERGQNDAVSSDTGGTAGSSTSASAAMCEGGSDEKPVTHKHCLCIRELVGVSWKMVLRNLSMDDTTIRNLEEDYKFCEVAEKCYQGLLKWTKIVGPEEATVKKLSYALQKAGCLKGLEALRNMPHESNC